MPDPVWMSDITGRSLAEAGMNVKIKTDQDRTAQSSSFGADWVELRDSAKADPVILHKILSVCAAHAGDPCAQRYHLWRFYA